MNKIKFQILSLLGKLRGSISIFFSAALVLLIIFEILVLKRAITTVLNIARANPTVQASQLVRINFNAYDKIVKRIQDAPSYVPDQSLYSDPFGSAVTGKDKPK